MLHALDAQTGGASVGRRASAGFSRLRRRLRAAATSFVAARPWRAARAMARKTGETWRVKRPRDLAMPVSGGLAILSAFILVVWAIGSGASRPRVL